MFDKDCCPICGYKFDMCQCRFSASAHPDRQKRQRVVFDHLHLLHPNQVQHVIDLQRSLRISYEDPEMEYIRNEMKKTNWKVKKLWQSAKRVAIPPLGAGDAEAHCNSCGHVVETDALFCPRCGRALTDKALKIVMTRLKELEKSDENENL